MSYVLSNVVTVGQLKKLAEKIHYDNLETPTLTFSDADIDVMVGNSSTITFTTDSDGVISVTTDDESIATATLNNGTITINALAVGSTTITLSIASSGNYKAVSETINVVVSAKPVPALTLSETDIEVQEGGDTTVTVTTDSSGTINVTSGDNNTATVSISGTTITITGVAAGSTTVTVNVVETSTSAARSAVIDVTVTERPQGLEGYTWAQIAAIGKAGIGANYFDIGDTKSLTLNGTVGTLALSNYDCKVFIIDFNYKGTNGVYFQGFKDANGVDIALCDDECNSNAGNTGAKKFAMNHWGVTSGNYNTNFGGWKGCDLRYDILGSTDKAPSDYGKQHTTSCVGYDATSVAKTSPVANTLMAALPSVLRAELEPLTIYTDNKGNKSNVAANVTSSVDYLPLLAEFEVFGAIFGANQYEQNQQVQLAYYANGNSKIKYKHNDATTACHWWLRSAHYNSASNFRLVSASGDGGGTGSISSYSCAVAPAFRLA